MFSRSRALTTHEMGGHHVAGPLGVDTYESHETAIMEACVRLARPESLVVVGLDASASPEKSAAKVMAKVTAFLSTRPILENS